MTSPFLDQTIVITGASQGIGDALARQLQRDGARLVLISRTAPKVEGPQVLWIQGDLADAPFRASLPARIFARYPVIDIVIHNAGAGIYGATWQTNPEDCERMFQLNILALQQLDRDFVPVMRKQGRGMLVHISSVLGLFQAPWGTLYSATKHAVTAYSEGLGMELRSSGIHVLTVFPGYIATGFQQNVISGAPPKTLKASRPRSSISPEQCATAIVRAMARGKRRLIVPWPYSALWLFHRASPALFRWILGRLYAPMERDLLQ